MNKRYDCVIVGSGLGGLSAAAMLAKNGMKVAVFEQADEFGGYGRTYQKDGFSFDFAVHSVFSWRFVKNYLRELGGNIDFDVVPSRRGDRIIFKDDGEYWATTIENISNSICRKFPEEADQIKKYYNDLTESMDLILKLGQESIQDPSKAVKLITKFPQLWNSSLEEIINHYLKSDEVKAYVYATQDAYLYDYAWNYSAYHLFHIKHINEGHAIKGGSKNLVNEFANIIRGNGGKLYHSTLVKQITVEDNKATGLILWDGTRIEAERAVISNADANLTLEKMIGLDKLPESMRAEYEIWDKNGYSLSYYIVNLGLDIDLYETYGMEYDLTIYFPSKNIPDVHKKINSGILPEDFWLWMVFPSVNDPTVAPSGCSVAIISLLVPYEIENETDCEKDYFDGFQKVKDKGEAYYEKKEEISKAMIQMAEDVFPEISKHIVVKEVWTPQSFQDMTLNHKGATMGFRVLPPDKTRKKYLNKLGMPIVTEIDQFYMVGHWTELGLSVGSVINSGRVAASDILGFKRPPISTSNVEDRVSHFSKKIWDV